MSSINSRLQPGQQGRPKKRGDFSGSGADYDGDQSMYAQGGMRKKPGSRGGGYGGNRNENTTNLVIYMPQSERVRYPDFSGWLLRMARINDQDCIYRVSSTEAACVDGSIDGEKANWKSPLLRNAHPQFCA